MLNLSSSPPFGLVLVCALGGDLGTSVFLLLPANTCKSPLEQYTSAGGTRGDGSGCSQVAAVYSPLMYLIGSLGCCGQGCIVQQALMHPPVGRVLELRRSAALICVDDAQLNTVQA